MPSAFSIRAHTLEKVLRQMAAAAFTLSSACAPDAAEAPDPFSDGGVCAPISFDAARTDDAAIGCDDFHRLPCGLPSETGVRGCFVDLITCEHVCGNVRLFYCVLAPSACVGGDAAVADGGPVEIECVRCATAGGRPPRGFRPMPVIGSAIGAHFAAMAHLESASIAAFIDLARSLAALCAPRSLRVRALRAAHDERRHARIVSRLARRFASKPPRLPRRTKLPSPSLFELVLDDAIEGCVHEAHGALLAWVHAGRSSDRKISRAMTRLAIDETDHATLAWDILGWGAPMLDSTERALVREAIARALVSLESSPPGEFSDAERLLVGHPTETEHRALRRAFAAWTRARADTIIGP